jgi:hypothetical protein
MQQARMCLQYMPLVYNVERPGHSLAHLVMVSTEVAFRIVKVMIHGKLKRSIKMMAFERVVSETLCSPDPAQFISQLPRCRLL